MTFPTSRPRRLRRTPAIRRLVAQTRPQASQLILPIFVRDGMSDPVPIPSMPHVLQHTVDSARAIAVQAAQAGVGGLMVFGVPRPEDKDATGSAGCDPDGICNRALRALRAEIGDSLVLGADTCLDEFTDHGHCGLLAEDGHIDNDRTLERYVAQALSQAEAGADLISPSGMMDGQVGAIRAGLDTAGYQHTAICAYSAKYASAFYGPFRDAVGSTLRGDRRTYQQDPANRAEGLRETLADVAEGADLVMVKPAGYYLDVLSDIAAAVRIPVAAYHVSGEYAMVCAAAERGWLDRQAALDEAVCAIVRAGAQIVLSYAAVELAQWWQQ